MGKFINEIKDTLAKGFRIVTNWFYENLMVFILKNIILCVLVETWQMKHLVLKMYGIITGRKIIFWG